MSFFRYPGGKTKLKKQIMEELCKHSSTFIEEYREPFFGGGSIGLEFLKENTSVKTICINDKDIGLACLWTATILYSTELKILIKKFIPTVEAFYSIKNELLSLVTMPFKKEDIINVGFKKLAIHQISYSGLGTKSGSPQGGIEQKSQYKIDCRWFPDYIIKKIDIISHLFSNTTLKNNQCTNLDFGNIILNTDCHALIYLDPPYFVKGNDLYQCGFTTEDHYRLASLLKNCPHKWLLSYDDCPEIRSLYNWAVLQSVDVTYNITATKNSKTGERKSRIKTELLIQGNN